MTEKRYGMVIDTQHGVGCQTCTVSCKISNEVPGSAHWNHLESLDGDVLYQSTGTFPRTTLAFRPLLCNHCENPVCAEACPTQAMHKDENGIVSVDPDRCVGCRYCEWNCPYGAPQFDPERKKMTKCDFCRDYLEQGLPPSCVAACPCRALDYGEYDELLKRYGEQAAIAPLPGPELIRPHFICAPNRHSKPQGSTEGLRGKRISNPEEV